MTKNVMSFLRRMVFVLSMLLSCLASYAQGTFSVKLRLLDSKTSEPIGFATVSLTPKGAEAATKYILTDAEGKASIAKVGKGTYTLKAEIMGYRTHYQEIAVEKTVNLGDVKMEEDVEQLDAASVSAVGNPIVVKKDTIEYNASSFKTSDNDMLEELLKKLPGVEVESDGSITANGETIKKITIDGKTFFMDDPQLASKNIPAKMIEKVKVVEKKSDQAIFTGIDDGEEETIIDLSIRPGMMQGWFGNVMAGGGSDIPGAGSDMDDPRFQGAAMVGRFTKKSQVSIILNGNNTNNRGFNDMAGSMMQGMRGGGGRGMGGWGGNSGISTSWMGGLNGAFTLLDGDMDLAGNYLYNGSDRFVEEESNRITYNPDGSRLIDDNKGTSTTGTFGHRFGLRLDHEFSENTSLLFEPQFNFGGGRYGEQSDFTTRTAFQGDTTLNNTGFTDNYGDNRNWSASGFLLFRQRLGKPGRTISANFRYSLSNNDLDGYNKSYTVYEATAESAKRDSVVNQHIDQNSESYSLSGRVVYTEPLGHDLFLEANYEYSWNKNSSFKKTYNSLSGLDDPAQIYDDVPDVNFSNDIYNLAQNHRVGANISYQKERFRAQLGASYNPTVTDNRTTGHEDYHKVTHNWSPQAMLNYEFNDNSNIRMFYSGRSAQPSTSQLLPVPDNSDPRNISFGNPYLQPYFNHNLRGMFGYTNKKTFTSVHARFGAGFVQNPITSARWYDADKVTYSMPVNGPASGSVDGRVMVNSPISRSGFSVYSMTNARYSQSASFIGKEGAGVSGSDYYDKENVAFDYDAFHDDFPTIDALEKVFDKNITQSLSVTQRLRLTYRNDFVELGLGGRTIVSKSWFTVNPEQKATWNNQVDLSMNWTIPGGINLIADADYNWYVGYTYARENEVILNAEITKLLFKNKFTLALKAYDILGQSKNLSVSDSANYHMETRNNTLGRYIILSLTYRFGNFGGGHRGPGGRPPGRPMGPPRR